MVHVIVAVLPVSANAIEIVEFVDITLQGGEVRIRAEICGIGFFHSNANAVEDLGVVPNEANFLELVHGFLDE